MLWKKKYIVGHEIQEAASKTPTCSFKLIMEAIISLGFVNGWVKSWNFIAVFIPQSPVVKQVSAQDLQALNELFTQLWVIKWGWARASVHYYIVVHEKKKRLILWRLAWAYSQHPQSFLPWLLLNFAGRAGSCETAAQMHWIEQRRFEVKTTGEDRKC